MRNCRQLFFIDGERNILGLKVRGVEKVENKMNKILNKIIIKY